MAVRHYAAHVEDEESYFVSMTDVVIGLLFVFIIMLMFFAMRFQEATQKQNEATQAQNEATQAQNDVTQKQNTLIEDLTDSERARADILQGIGNLLRRKEIKFIIVESEGILRLPEEILLASSSWELNAKGIDALKILGEALDQVLPCYTTGPRARQDNCPRTKAKIEAIFIEGHADADRFRSPIIPRNIPRSAPNTPPARSGQSGSFFSPFISQDSSAQTEPRRPSTTSRPAGPPKDNLDLSTLRASSTFRELLRAKRELSEYLSPENSSVLSVSGYGEYRPLTFEPGESPEAYKQRNRRIDLRVLMATPKSQDAKQLQRDLQRSGTHP